MGRDHLVGEGADSIAGGCTKKDLIIYQSSPPFLFWGGERERRVDTRLQEGRERCGGDTRELL